MLPALAGADLIYGLGMLESGITMGFGQMVMDDEMAGMIRYSLQGMPVNDYTLDIDGIKKVGIGGNHLKEKRTKAHARGYQSAPKFIDRDVIENWELGGSRDMRTRCEDEARHILETHKPIPIPEDAAALIREMINREERDLGLPLSTYEPYAG